MNIHKFAEKYLKEVEQIVIVNKKTEQPDNTLFKNFFKNLTKDSIFKEIFVYETFIYESFEKHYKKINNITKDLKYDGNFKRIKDQLSTYFDLIKIQFKDKTTQNFAYIQPG